MELYEYAVTLGETKAALFAKHLKKRKMLT
jgi:hypothetical protein